VKARAISIERTACNSEIEVNNNYYEVNMTAATDTDIREIKDLIQALDKRIEGLDKKIEVGFTKVEGQLKGIEERLGAVEASNKVIDGRLWGLIATLLGLTVTALLGIFVRFLFQHESIL
jgi:uncharacterized protein YpuA (DUF1002 family)